MLVSAEGVIVAFAAGTHVFCARMPRAECDPGLVVTREDPLSIELGDLVRGGWTRADPWTIAIRKEQGLERVVALLQRAAARAG